MKKKLAVIGGLVGLLAIGGLWVVKGLKQSSHYTILLSGNIELTEVNIAFKTSGQLVELNVEEGDPVKKGMVVARLDQDRLLRERDRALAAIASARSRLAQLQTDIEHQRETVAGQIQQRQAELNQAEAYLKELLAGSRTQEIQEARAAVEQARAEADRARNDWTRFQELFETRAISASARDEAKTRYESAAALLKQAEERLALVLEGPRQETIEAARAQVGRAKAALRLAEATRLELRKKEQELATRRAEIKQAEAELAVTDSELRDTVAVSPIDGVVLVKAAETGEVLAAGTTVATIGDLDHPWLRGYLNERDLGRVKLGAKVKVTTDSFPGKIYWGRVSFIASDAEFTPKQIQTKEERVKLVYRIKIDLPNPGHELKSNMPADAEILLDTTP
ncbi:MAG: efflux RND transporter periplasmic adaptor subunit [candidate division NC10 bacterium]|nr:efflux RND transporter periplasmic adaptor subunit [candidate division NC10 bacterium]